MSDRAPRAGARAGAGAPGAEPASPGVIAPPPLIYLAGLGAGFILQETLGGTPVSGPVRWTVGALLSVAGVALARGFIRAFHRAGTPVSPFSPSTALVTTGPYRFTRNPAYLGMALAYCGIALLTASLWVLVPLPFVLIAIDRGVIAREERYLEQTFGEPYLRYKASTRRWL